MRKLLVGLGAVVTLLGGSMALPAHADPVPTNPVASPETIYPYVQDGYLDTTSITWSTDQVVDLQVYDDSWVLVGERTDVQANQFTWDGRVGVNLNEDLPDPGTYEFCVNSTDPGSIPAGWMTSDCVTVNLVTIHDFYVITKTRPGRHFAATWGDCAYHKLVHAVRVTCDLQETRTFRYVIRKPALQFGESFAGQSYGADIDQFGGDGYAAVSRSANRVRVYVQGRFDGRIINVWRSFLIELHL